MIRFIGMGTMSVQTVQLQQYIDSVARAGLPAARHGGYRFYSRAAARGITSDDESLMDSVVGRTLARRKKHSPRGSPDRTLRTEWLECLAPNKNHVTGTGCTWVWGLLKSTSLYRAVPGGPASAALAGTRNLLHFHDACTILAKTGSPLDTGKYSV
eukprot:gene1410-biopygen2636